MFQRRTTILCLGAAIALMTGFAFADEKPARKTADQESQKSGLEVQSVVLRLFEEAEVPAQEAGVVTGVAVREGQRVKQGELLAQIDDQVARLAAEATRAKYDISRAKATNDVRVRYAQKAIEV